jgi:hypothetical protein
MNAYDQVWICKSCLLEFDPYSEDVELIIEPSRGRDCLILVNRQAHTLVLKPWEEIQKIRKAESRSLSLATIKAEQQGLDEFVARLIG